MRILRIIGRWTFAFCIPLLLLSASIGVAVNSLWLYKYGFHKYDVAQTTGLEDAELEKAARGLIAYFNSSEEPLKVIVKKDGQDFTLFNEREISHMKDVKSLFRLDYAIFFGSLVYLLVYAGIGVYRRRQQHLRHLAKLSLIGSSLTLGIMLALWIASLVNFQGLFLLFHMLSFANDFWQLNPATDYLIMLFPGGFWYDAVIFIAIATTAMAVLLGVLSWAHLRFNKKRSANEMA